MRQRESRVERLVANRQRACILNLGAGSVPMPVLELDKTKWQHTSEGDIPMSMY